MIVAVAAVIATTAVVVVIATTAADRSVEKMAKLRVKWVKSSIGYPKDQKTTVKALGLHKLQQTVEHEDQPAVRGMINKVSHLLQVEEVIE
jgi:large subunit ribosomal protein L30